MSLTGSSHIGFAPTELNNSGDSQTSIERNLALAQVIYNQSDSAVIIIDNNGTILKANPACLQITGFTEADIVGKRYMDVMVPDDLVAEAHEKLHKMIETHETLHCESRWLRKDGNQCILKGTFTAVLDPTGNLELIVGIGIDVTEERKAQEDLRKSQFRFELAVESTRDGIWDVNLDTGEVYYSPAWKAIIGFEDHELPNHQNTWLDRIHPDDLEAVKAYQESYLTNPKPKHAVEFRMRHQDGSWRWILSQGKATYGDDGRIVRVVGSHRDITGNKTDELALRESETRLREAQDIAKLGTWELDLATDKVWWSPQTYLIYGLPMDVPPPSMDQLLLTVHPEDRQTVRESIIQTLRTGEPYRVKRRIFRPNGELRYIITSARIICDESGRRTRVVGVVQDVTDQQLAEDTIVRAREQALEASRLKSEFLANMSHEIRTPMNGVIGMVDMLLDTKLDQDQQKFVCTIKASAEGLMTILNDILDFSKIEAGKLNLEESDVDVLGVLEEVASIVNRSCQEKGLDLQIDADYSKSAHYIGDPTRIRQIILNLATNAVKFTQSGTITLGISTSTEGVQLWVQDTGMGIVESRHRAIFDSFTQADGSTTRQFGGTGLGLAIVRQLVDLMSGSVALVSGEGKGSRFDVFLPLELSPLKTSVPILAEKTIHVVTSSKPLKAQVERFIVGQEGTVRHYTSISQFLVEIRETTAEWVWIDSTSIDRDEYTSLPNNPDQKFDHLFLIANAATPCPAGFSGCISLPLTRYEVALSIQSYGAKYPDGENGEPVPYRGKRLLLVEDNIINQQVAQYQAKRLGFMIDIANNGKEAVTMANQAEFDVILMDVQMPEMDGLTATTLIRQNEHPSKRPIILAMTAHAMQGDRDKCLAAGMDDYISKPVRAKEMGDVIQQWLESSKAGTSRIDWEYLHEASNHDDEFEQQIITIYMHTMPPLMTQLVEAIHSNATHNIIRLSHTLKGSSRSIGANALADICDEIEQVAKSGDPFPSTESIKQQFDELIEECRQFTGAPAHDQQSA